MEKIQETPPPPPPQATPTTTITQENEIQPPTKPISQESPKDVCCCKPATTPDRLKVPKAFKYPERYRSPTDLMMSPVSRGLLARSRKSHVVLPPHKIQPQGPQPLLKFQLQEAGLFQC